MSKKSTAARQSQGGRRPPATAKQASVALVRAPRPEQGALAEAQPEMRTAKTAEQDRPTHAAKAAGSPKPAVVAPAAKPRAPQIATKPAAPKSEHAATKSAAPMTREQATRIARARATQRARAANAISPEHYSYVLGDLKLIAGVAVAMFATIIILHFVLPGV